MARSKRRCATSLHEVSKWTVPSRWSVSSWARAGCTNAQPSATVAAKAAAEDDLIIASPCFDFESDGNAASLAESPAGGQFELGPAICYSAARSHRSRAADDPALHPARARRDLGGADPLPHLVRDRGACGRRHGRAQHHPEGRRAKNLGE